MATTYQPHRRRQQVLYNSKGSQNRVTIRIVVGGAEVTPDAAPTIAIYDQAGTAVLAAANMTLVSGADASYYYDIDTTTTTTWVAGRGYRAQISATIGGSVWLRQIWLDVVKRLLVFDLCDDDLVALRSSLGRQFETGRVDHSLKIRLAEDMIIADLFERRDQGEPVQPDRLIGSEQLFQWHRAQTMALICDDLEQGDERERFEALAADYKAACLAAAAYGSDQDTDPDADADQENINFARVTQ